MTDNLGFFDAFRDYEFKDSAPLDTVSRIKSILSNMNISTTEEWYDSNVPYCFTVQVRINDTSFCVNGKGLTRDFALASAYGELMERFQLGYVGSLESQKGGNYNFQLPEDFALGIDIYNENPARYKKWAELYLKYTGDTIDPLSVCTQYSDDLGNVSISSFYNLCTNKKDCIPSSFLRRVYTTNGCAAGNSFEEATVQAISEIVERHNQLEIVERGVSLPDIPEDYLEQFDVAFQIINYIRSKGYRVVVKDCSLGKQFPVVAVFYIQNSTGKYHVHFGAYPIFEIALERALTESFQGRDIDHVATFVDYKYNRSEIYNIKNLTDEFQFGCSEKLPEMFVSDTMIPFNRDVGFSGLNNKELFAECISFFKDQGLELLVRDCSSLGFPTVQVVVPGYSEHYSYRINDQRDTHRYHGYAIRALRHPSCSKTADFLGLFKHLTLIGQYSKKSVHAHGFSACANLSTSLNNKEQQVLLSLSLAYAYFELKQINNVIDCLDKILKTPYLSDDQFLIAIKRYFSLVSHKYTRDYALSVIQYFHSDAVLTRIKKCISENLNPFADYVLKCDLTSCDSCALSGRCYQRRIDELTEIVNKRLNAITFEDTVAKIHSIIS